jgi:hypothetical protein
MGIFRKKISIMAGVAQELPCQKERFMKNAL